MVDFVQLIMGGLNPQWFVVMIKAFFRIISGYREQHTIAVFYRENLTHGF